jgi:uncharacterized OB-fold protein
MTFEHLPPPSLDDPAADERTQPFWDAAAKGQLVAPRCTECGTFRMPPGRFCPNCLSMELEYVPLPGTGTVFTSIVVHEPLRSGTEGHVPYVPAAIEADGAPGIRFISNVVDCDPDAVEIGMKVRVVFHPVSDTLTLPFWRPA